MRSASAPSFLTAIMSVTDSIAISALPRPIGSKTSAALPSSERRIRVALFLPTLGGGGAERAMVTLANALAERRFAVDFVLWTDGGPFRSLLSAKVHVVALGTYNPVKLVFGFAHFLRTCKP